MDRAPIARRVHLRTAFVGLMAVAILALGVSLAFAQTDPYSDNEPDVKPTLIIDESEPEVEPAPPGVLPFTGGDVTVFLIGGLAAISVGTLIVKRTRARA